MGGEGKKALSSDSSMDDKDKNTSLARGGDKRVQIPLWTIRTSVTATPYTYIILVQIPLWTIRTQHPCFC